MVSFNSIHICILFLYLISNPVYPGCLTHEQLPQYNASYFHNTTWQHFTLQHSMFLLFSDSAPNLWRPTSIVTNLCHHAASQVVSQDVMIDLWCGFKKVYSRDLLCELLISLFSFHTLVSTRYFDTADCWRFTLACCLSLHIIHTECYKLEVG